MHIRIRRMGRTAPKLGDVANEDVAAPMLGVGRKKSLKPVGELRCAEIGSLNLKLNTGGPFVESDSLKFCSRGQVRG